MKRNLLIAFVAFFSLSANAQNVTLVSAYLTNVNKMRDRNIEDYINYAEHLLQCPLPKVIFIDKKIYDLYYKNTDDDPLTHFIPIEKDSLFLDKSRNAITHFKVLTDNPTKDTLEYMMLICNKTEWVNQAIELNHFNTTQYVWVDFGIYHMIRNEELINEHLCALQNKSYDKVRIANCWNLAESPAAYGCDIYRNVAWYFLGSVFGGDRAALIKFNQLMKTKCSEIIRRKSTLMWEVNIWYLIYLENKQLFSPYFCRFDQSILGNY